MPHDLACVVLDTSQTGWPECGLFQSEIKIRENIIWDEYALKMAQDRGFTKEKNQEAPDIKTVLEAFKGFLSEYKPVTLAGQNIIEYDMPILKQELKYSGVQLGNIVQQRQFLDTRWMAYNDLVLANKKLSSASLGEVAKYFGINLSELEHHTAIGDVRATAQVLRLLMRRLQSIDK